jgi:hypothetical protein
MPDPVATGPLGRIPSELSCNKLAERIFIKNISDSNLKKKDFLIECKPLFKVGPKNRVIVHWVTVCEPTIRKALSNKKRVYIEWTSCKLNYYIIAQRCYKCQSYGHITEYCKKQEEICGHCATEDHNFKDCPNKKKIPTCSNCMMINRPSNHKVSDTECPCYEKGMQQVIDKTNYGTI